MQSCDEAARDAVSELSFKRCVRELFGISPTKTHSSGKVVTVYKGLKYSDSCPQPEDKIDLGTFMKELPLDWYWVKMCEEFRIAGYKTGIYIDNNEIVKEVHVKNDGSIRIFLGNISVHPIDIGLPQNVKECSICMRDYLQLVGKCKVCLGKETPIDFKGSHRTQHGEIHDYRSISSGCQRLMAVITHSDICHRCYSQHIAVFHKDNDTAGVSTPQHSPQNGEAPVDETEHMQHISNDEAFHILFPNVSNNLADLLYSQARCSQAEATGADARSRRWPKSVISLALSLWIASPAAYRILRDTLYLPCEKLLQMYKNSIDKSPGINFSMCQWLSKECERTGTPKQGGILFDEMHVQPGVQLERYGEGLKMFGYVDFGENNNGIDTASKNEHFHLATTVLQFVFLAFNGLRFPFSYMLSNGLIAGHLTSIFLDAVNILQSFDFHISFVCMDGASVNRAFLNMICDPGTYLAQNITTIDSTIACIMDFSHVVKKIRNSLYSSGNESTHKRKIIHPKGDILWEVLVKAYHWDVQNNFLRIHRKLTRDHFYLSNTLKMRNHLAEEVLNADMLLLLKEYQKHNSTPEIEAMIQVVNITSPFISIFRSNEPINHMQDERITKLSEIQGFFSDWHRFCQEKKDPSCKVGNFITVEAYQDLLSCIEGFIHLCDYRVSLGKSVTPRLINSDVVENIFCQQRATYSGANSNPDASQYRYIHHEMHCMHDYKEPPHYCMLFHGHLSSTLLYILPIHVHTNMVDNLIMQVHFVMQGNKGMLENFTNVCCVSTNRLVAFSSTAILPTHFTPCLLIG